MVLATGTETVNADTGEVLPEAVRILPSRYKCSQTGAVLPVENRGVWVDSEGQEP